MVCEQCEQRSSTNLHIVLDDNISHPIPHGPDVLALTQGRGNLAVLPVQPEDVLLARAAPSVQVNAMRHVLSGLAGNHPPHRGEGGVHLLEGKIGVIVTHR